MPLDSTYDFHTPPYDHQRRAFEMSKDMRSFAYLMDMGTGKTKVALDVAAYLRERDLIDCVLVLAPKGVHAQWINEQLPAHWPPRVGHRPWLYLNGRKPPEWVLDRNDGYLRIVAMNIESLSYATGPAILKSLVRVHGMRMLIIVDEASRIKNPGASRTKVLQRLSQYVKYKRILTGTPVTQGLQDLYAPFQFLEYGCLGVSNYMSFRNRYCETEHPPGQHPRAVKIIGYKNQDDLMRRVAKLAFQIKKEECLDLPDKVYVTRTVELSPEQRTHYLALKKEMLTFLDSGEVVSPLNALDAMIKLQQVVCGYLGDQDLPCPRVNDCCDVVEEAGKTIVWCRFKRDVYRLAKELAKRGIGYVIHTGDQTTPLREEAKRLFMTDPATRVFLATAASGGIGLNLTAATTVVYYSNDFSAETRWQSEDRAHRIGQTQKVTYVDLVAPGTIDRQILGALRAKESISKFAYDKLRSIIEGEENV